MMKQKRLVSMIGALVLIIGAIVLITGCPQPNNSGDGNPPMVENIVIKFDNTKIKCSDMQNKDVPNGTTLAAGTEVWFKAINIPTGQIVNKWTIGKKIRNATSSTTWYKISKNDADGNNIKVSYTLRSPAKLKIVFDATKVRCEKQGVEIGNNSEVLEQDRLYFTPKNIAPDKVAVWEIKDKGEAYFSNFNSLSYRVKMRDANSSNEIELVYSERNKEKITVQFDASKIKCTNQETTVNVTSNSKILEGTVLKVETIDGSEVEWEIGGTTYIGSEKEIDFTVYKGDTENGIILVSFK
ncbi:hypothetical protein E4O05_06935 [Treponema sp. OMZ 787]|uniref:hypothetical protein n=1 Tax=Treponema sp. OMZ 787 TaxID=2563669 RepID=UPI0020A54C2B|nr:hypothetical protein [Treponema sp. OMZ 787]UTC61303.1 hypothetical protein E4O05_06880 [Treponema sp. OMZ 787]UTC61314.1 hypothetical protein E4O05_06935 [Treponema sp. OMZ 787]